MFDTPERGNNTDVGQCPGQQCGDRDKPNQQQLLGLKQRILRFFLRVEQRCVRAEEKSLRDDQPRDALIHQLIMMFDLPANQPIVFGPRLFS